MAEMEFLDAVAAWLASSLATAPASIGVLEPAAAADLPAVALGLEQTSRAGGGVGVHATAVRGALPWQERIDLAAPFLAAEPGFSLLDASRRELVLPHGGLVRQDGSEGPLAAGDLRVVVADVPRVLVAANPTGDQFTADAAAGKLFFATPLPATGTLVADVFLGQWEQRLVRIAGVLRVDVFATEPAQLAEIARDVLAALTAPASRAGIRRLLALDVIGVSSASIPQSGHADARRQQLRFTFAYEHEVDAPESSGGVIRQIPVQTNLNVP